MIKMGPKMWESSTKEGKRQKRKMLDEQCKS
jgi:hypothetical protein